MVYNNTKFVFLRLHSNVGHIGLKNDDRMTLLVECSTEEGSACFLPAPGCLSPYYHGPFLQTKESDAPLPL